MPTLQQIHDAGQALDVAIMRAVKWRKPPPQLNPETDAPIVGRVLRDLVARPREVAEAAIEYQSDAELHDIDPEVWDEPPATEPGERVTPRDLPPAAGDEPEAPIEASDEGQPANVGPEAEDRILGRYLAKTIERFYGSAGALQLLTRIVTP